MNCVDNHTETEFCDFRVREAGRLERKETRQQVIEEIEEEAELFEYTLYHKQVTRSDEFINGYDYCKKGTMETLEEFRTFLQALKNNETEKPVQPEN